MIVGENARSGDMDVNADQGEEAHQHPDPRPRRGAAAHAAAAADPRERDRVHRRRRAGRGDALGDPPAQAPAGEARARTRARPRLRRGRASNARPSATTRTPDPPLDRPRGEGGRRRTIRGRWRSTSTTPPRRRSAPRSSTRCCRTSAALSATPRPPHSFGRAGPRGPRRRPRAAGPRDRRRGARDRVHERRHRGRQPRAEGRGVGRQGKGSSHRDHAGGAPRRRTLPRLPREVRLRGRPGAGGPLRARGPGGRGAGDHGPDDPRLRDARQQRGRHDPADRRDRRGGPRPSRASLFHVDAVQAAPWLDLDVSALGADLVALAAHKVEGPKGTGALWIRRGTHILAQQHGGSQERHRRAGHRERGGRGGHGDRLRAAPRRSGRTVAPRVRGLRDRLPAALLAVDGVELTGHPTERLPHILSLIVAGHRRRLRGAGPRPRGDRGLHRLRVRDGLDGGQPRPVGDGLPGRRGARARCASASAGRRRTRRSTRSRGVLPAVLAAAGRGRLPAGRAAPVRPVASPEVAAG